MSSPGRCGLALSGRATEFSYGPQHILHKILFSAIPAIKPIPGRANWYIQRIRDSLFSVSSVKKERPVLHHKCRTSLMIKLCSVAFCRIAKCSPPEISNSVTGAFCCFPHLKDMNQKSSYFQEYCDLWVGGGVQKIPKHVSHIFSKKDHLTWVCFPDWKYFFWVCKMVCQENPSLDNLVSWLHLFGIFWQ